MAQRAFLLGGTGKTGRRLAALLGDRGWNVVVASRGEQPVPRGLDHVRVDRNEPESLRDALGGGADVLVDFVAFEPEHADQLLALRDVVGSVVVVSSGAVYADAAGRSLEAVRDGEVVEFPLPISERQPTVALGADTYSSKKAAIERRLLDQRALPATVVRAGAIYGPGDLNSREWHFVKRALDGRRVIVLSYGGASRFHPVAVDNLAELLRLAAERPATRVVNAGDPEPPTVLEISRLISRHLGHEWTEVLLPGPPHADVVGANPWGVPRPWVMDMTEAELQLAYRPVTTYARAVGATVDWLVDATKGRDWREVLPRAAEVYANLFDYDAEDGFLRGFADG
jgi:nucleoside-diphosphate-sugar epimerase